MEGEIGEMKFKCVKCKKYYTLSESETDPIPRTKSPSPPLPFKKEFWFITKDNICVDCDPTSRKNKRKESLNIIFGEKKKWWDIF